MSEVPLCMHGAQLAPTAAKQWIGIRGGELHDYFIDRIMKSA